MDANPRVSEADVYAANLDYTLKELQRKIDEHQAELQRVSPNDPDRATALP